MADCLFDFGVTPKEILLSFDDFPRDPERAVGPAQTRSRQGLPLVVNGVSGWVRSKMGEVGSGGTSDIVKVMSVDPLSPVLNPWLVIPHYWFNKTKQHTHPLPAPPL